MLRCFYGLPQEVRLAVNADADILVFGYQLSAPQDPAEIIEMIYNAVESVEVAEIRIGELTKHIIKLKNTLRARTKNFTDVTASM